MNSGSGRRVAEKLLTLFFGQLSDTHTHTHSGNSRAHNTAIPQPACVRIVYSSWNIMLSILFNDMHSSWEGEEEEEGVLGLDRHFSYWQCLIQSFRAIPQPWSPANFNCQPCVYTTSAAAAAFASIPLRNQSTNGPKRGLQGNIQLSSIFRGIFFPSLSLFPLFFWGILCNCQAFAAAFN